MKVGIHQPQYLPWLPYIRKAAKSDVFIILDSVAFQKNGLQNRNRIKTEAGAQWLTVPVKQELGQSILETRIDNRANWRRKHWASISQNYGRAAGFAARKAELAAIYEREWDGLADLTVALLELQFKWFGVRTKVLRSSRMKATGTASELVLNLCLEAGAKTYVSGVGGKGYLDEDSFARAGVALVYEPPELPRDYPQLHAKAGFFPDLAAIDILFNCGDAWPRYLNQEVTSDAG